MWSRLLIGVLAGGLASCDPRPEDVPDSVPAGSIDAVTREVAAGGAASAMDGIAGLGLVPVAAPRPAIPLITPPHVILFYCFPRVSRDGQAWRNGVWIARVITPFSWGVQDALHDDALRLAQLGGMRLDEQGQLVIDRDAYRNADGVPAPGTTPSDGLLPWRPSADQPTTRTTVIYPASGAAVTSSSSGTSPYLQPNGSVNLQEVQKAMAAAQDRLRAAQAQHAAAAGGGSGLVPATPVPGQALTAPAAMASPAPMAMPVSGDGSGATLTGGGSTTPAASAPAGEP